MKTKLPLIAALYCGLSAVGSAFTLDFSGLTIGDSLPKTINVPFYGDVTFTAVSGSPTIQLFDPGAVKAISFNGGETVSITFLGNIPLNVTNQYVGVGAGENFVFSATADPKQYLLSLNPVGQGVNAGLQSVIFDQVPEPSSALLGVLGTSLLVLRRRR